MVFCLGEVGLLNAVQLPSYMGRFAEIITETQGFGDNLLSSDQILQVRSRCIQRQPRLFQGLLQGRVLKGEGIKGLAHVGIGFAGFLQVAHNLPVRALHLLQDCLEGIDFVQEGDQAGIVKSNGRAGFFAGQGWLAIDRSFLKHKTRL